MQYSQFKDKKISRLGFGMMRLPLRADKSVDIEESGRLVDMAIQGGVNYFDTAYSYLNSQSEIITGKLLAKYPRDSFFLASKFPGHQLAETYYPAPIFEEQLKKCNVDYFDFYLLHNVCENSLDVYLNPKWGILDYFLEQKRIGRIRHLGFSCHARPDTMEKFLDYCGDKMEFCQIQMNYLDWTLQEANKKYELLTRRNIPVWVMEPVRGGRLARLSDTQARPLKEARPDESIASWSFRWLHQFPNVKVILSGMSSREQVEDNIGTFSSDTPISQNENTVLETLAERLKNALPCTACRYCVAGCPKKLDIPRLISAYNDIKFDGGTTIPMEMDSLPADKLPSACIACGACTKICPQKIDIPAAMKDFTHRLDQLPKWADICRERVAAAKAAVKGV